MPKDFDGWNKIKKEIDSGGPIIFCNPHEIWWCSLGLNIGIEANGRSETFERPVLILQVFNQEMIWVIPITSTFKKSKFYHHFVFNNRDQSLNLTQIRTISAKRLKRKIGFVSDEEFAAVMYKLSEFFKE